MKNLFFVFFLFVGMMSHSATLQYQFNSNQPLPCDPNPCDQPGYHNVYIVEYPNRCELKCEGCGPKVCTWFGQVFRTPDKDIADDAQIDDLRNYAKSQICTTSSGTYSNNLIKESGRVYYRTITWSVVNSTTMHDEITVTYEE